MRQIARKQNNFRNNLGVILPTAILFLAALIPLCGLSIDVGYYGTLRGNLERATEAAATSGAETYFRTSADAGLAANEAAKVFKMNITSGIVTNNQFGASGQSTSMNYSATYSSADGISSLFRQNSITLNIAADRSQGSFSVSTQHTLNPFFASFLSPSARTITIAREIKIPKYDVVLLNDLSDSMKSQTIKTFVGRAWIADCSGGSPRHTHARVATIRNRTAGTCSPSSLENDVILYQAQSRIWDETAGMNTISSTDYDVTIDEITDVVVNSPGSDINGTATYDDGTRIYTDAPDGSYITNFSGTNGLARTNLTGIQVSDLSMTTSISYEDRQLEQTFSDNNNNNSRSFATYFQRASAYIEPHASLVRAIRSFTDKLSPFDTTGSNGLKLALATYGDRYASGQAEDFQENDLSSKGSTNRKKYMRRVLPSYQLSSTNDYNAIINGLNIAQSAVRGNGKSMTSRVIADSFPFGENHFSEGTTAVQDTFLASPRKTDPNVEKVVVIFTSSKPTDSDFRSQIGSLHSQGIKIHTILLANKMSASDITDFKSDVESQGGEPVIVITDPLKLKEAFAHVADELGFKFSS